MGRLLWDSASLGRFRQGRFDAGKEENTGAVIRDRGRGRNISEFLVRGCERRREKRVEYRCHVWTKGRVRSAQVTREGQERRAGVASE